MTLCNSKNGKPLASELLIKPKKPLSHFLSRMREISVSMKIALQTFRISDVSKTYMFL